jgi:hypothetical protein
MDIKNIYGKVVYTAPKATTMQEAVDQAIADKVTMRGWVISNCKVSYCTVSYCTVSDCTVSGGTVSGGKVSDCKVSYCTVSDCTVSGGTVSGGKVSDCKVSDCTVSYCTVSYCTVSDCTVIYCTVSGGKVSGGKVSDCTVIGGTVSDCTVSEKPLAFLKGFAGLYKYNVWSVLFADGSRWVRMGCLFKSLEDWDKIGIRKSNLSEFPDDGSDRSEERAAAFEFAKAAALRMKLPKEGTNA